MHSRPHLKTYFLILIMIIAGPVGNVLLAKAMKKAGAVSYWPPAELLDAFLHVFGHWTIWVGIVSQLAFIVAFMLALSIADYSFVQPAAALGYFVTAVLGVTVLHEKVPLVQWAGTVVICLGVSFIRGTNPRTTESSQ